MNNLSIYDLAKNRPALLTWSKGMEDAELIKLTMNGNNDAYSVILHRYYRFMYRVIKNIIWHDEESRDDAMQETSIKILRLIQNGKFNLEYRFSTLVFCYSRWTAWAVIKRAQSIISLDTLTKDFIGIKFSVPAEQETQMINEENRKELHHHINRLPKAQKQILILSEYFKMSYKEIAKFKDQSSDKISNQRQDAIDQLRKALGAKYRQPLYDRTALGVVTKYEAYLQAKQRAQSEKVLSRTAAAVKRLREQRLAEQNQL